MYYLGFVEEGMICNCKLMSLFMSQNSSISVWSRLQLVSLGGTYQSWSVRWRWGYDKVNRVGWRCCMPMPAARCRRRIKKMTDEDGEVKGKRLCQIPRNSGTSVHIWSLVVNQNGTVIGIMFLTRRADGTPSFTLKTLSILKSNRKRNRSWLFKIFYVIHCARHFQSVHLNCGMIIVPAGSHPPWMVAIYTGQRTLSEDINLG
jgi:hypothetical protein